VDHRINVSSKLSDLPNYEDIKAGIIRAFDDRDSWNVSAILRRLVWMRIALTRESAYERYLKSPSDIKTRVWKWSEMKHQQLRKELEHHVG
jgi:hypothetical protein